MNTITHATRHQPWGHWPSTLRQGRWIWEYPTLDALRMIETPSEQITPRAVDREMHQRAGIRWITRQLERAGLVWVSEQNYGGSAEWPDRRLYLTALGRLWLNVDDIEAARVLNADHDLSALYNPSGTQARVRADGDYWPLAREAGFVRIYRQQPYSPAGWPQLTMAGWIYADSGSWSLLAESGHGSPPWGALRRLVSSALHPGIDESEEMHKSAQARAAARHQADIWR